MNSRKIVLAYLANRRTGAFAERAIVQVANRAGLLNKPLTEAECFEDLRWMANSMRWVDMITDPESGAALWSVMDEGMRRWNLDGRLAV